jgi:hypothetical protein
MIVKSQHLERRQPPVTITFQQLRRNMIGHQIFPDRGRSKNTAPVA